MELTKNGVTLSVENDSLFDLVLTQALGAAHPALRQGIAAIPRIGASWQGGIFVGIVRGRNGQPDYPLILGDAIEAGKEITWDKAMTGAAAMNLGGFTDWRLPFRAEQSLLFANVPELFEKDWYWSCEQHAAAAVCAWLQHFGYGYQLTTHESNNYRARAVRRSGPSGTC